MATKDKSTLSKKEQFADLLLQVNNDLAVTKTLNEALEKIWKVIRAANGYVDRQAPWKLKTTDKDRMGTVLFLLAEVIRRIAIMMQPFVPTSANKVLDQLCVPENSRKFACLKNDFNLEAGTILPKPVGVFPRYVDASDVGNKA